MATKTLEEYYINNNPGNIKYTDKGGTEGVDYYLSATGTGIKYRKFNSKAEGLKGILDVIYCYASTDDKSGKVIKNYGAELRHAYNVAKNLDYDNNDELKKLIQGVTHFENSANSQDYRAYYTDKDYDDAIKLFQEERLLYKETIDEQIKDAEMQGLNLQ